MLLKFFMPFVSGWWKHSVMMCHGTSLPNSAFGDITLLSLKSAIVGGAAPQKWANTASQVSPPFIAGC